MTSLICWVGADSRGPSSAYFASDSRISWGTSSGWDNGQKVFACTSLPDMFAYCGDVVFPYSVLNQVVAMVDRGLLYDASCSPAERRDKLEQLLQQSFSIYPAAQRQPFSVLYGTRSTEGATPAVFHLAQIDWKPQSGWSRAWLPIPNSSALVVALGSGTDLAKESNERWNQSDAGGTSRAVFSGFCDHLRTGADPRSGGPPQLAAIYRKGPARVVGVVTSAGKSLLGLPIHGPGSSVIDWRNELFEVCDPVTGARAMGADHHVRPGSL
jgi:hypothetical protein